MYFSLKIDCLLFFILNMICIDYKTVSDTIVKQISDVSTFKLSSILFYMQKTWFLVQNPWLHTITQLKSRFSGIIKCTYGQHNPKSGGKLGRKIIWGQNWSKQARNSFFYILKKMKSFWSLLVYISKSAFLLVV